MDCNEFVSGLYPVLSVSMRRYDLLVGAHKIRIASNGAGNVSDNSRYVSCDLSLFNVPGKFGPSVAQMEESLT